LALPRQNIFIAAGRLHLGQLLPMMFSAGASGMMVGDFLTTPNRSVDDDLRMIEELGLETSVCGDTRPELAGCALSSQTGYAAGAGPADPRPSVT
jgi:biotin synthase